MTNSDRFPHIESITLLDTLPRVFESEKIPDSQLWRRTLTLHRGKRYLVEAASGTGKSSLCAFLTGARNDYAGTIRFDNTDIRTIDTDTWQFIRRCRIAYLPQELALFPELTALQNIELKNNLTGHCEPQTIRQRLEQMGIAARTDFPVGRMSIGQQQRVAIIRALCQPFDFLLLDEPVSHLDAANNALAANMAVEEASRQGAAIIATSVGNPIDIDDMITLRL